MMIQIHFWSRPVLSAWKANENWMMAVRMASARSMSALGERSRDEQPLDLARAFVDLRDARVAVVALHRVVLDVAVAAMDLDRFRADPFGELGGEKLRLRGLGEARQAL